MNIREFAKTNGLTYDQASALVTEVKAKINPTPEELEGLCLEMMPMMKQTADATRTVKTWLRARTSNGTQNMATNAVGNQLALTEAESAKFRRAGHYKGIAGMRAMNLGMIEVLGGAEINDPEIVELIHQQQQGVYDFLDCLVEGVQQVEMNLLPQTKQHYLPSANVQESA